MNHTTARVMTVVQIQCRSRNRRTVGAAMTNPRMAAISTIASKLARCQ